MRAYFLLIVSFTLVGALASKLSPPASGGAAKVEDRPAMSSVEAVPSSPAQQFARQDGALELQRDVDGHFYADVKINGSAIHMLVDTGASSIALSRDDALSAGVPTSISMNEVVGMGADGAVHGQRVTLERVELGPLTGEGMDAVVLNSGRRSLLGQSFLSRFASVEIEGDRMILR